MSRSSLDNLDHKASVIYRNVPDCGCKSFVAEGSGEAKQLPKSRPAGVPGTPDPYHSMGLVQRQLQLF